MPEGPLHTAIIGGTGFYELLSLERPTQLAPCDTQVGPSGAMTLGEWEGQAVAFLPRHGADHATLPHQINYRANMLALQQLQPRFVIAVNAVGSMAEAAPPGSLVIPDQIIDYTWGREHTLAGVVEGVPQHVDMTHPYDPVCRRALLAAAQGEAAMIEATYGATQGPRLETPAEIARMRRDGCDLVGMTGMPEAALARELGLRYASLCIVANWAAGFEGAGEITMDEVMDNLRRAMHSALALLGRFLGQTQ